MARRPKKKQLFNIRLDELSLVDDPGNQEAKVTLFKRADGAQSEEATMADITAVTELTKKLEAALAKMEDQTNSTADLQKKLDALQKENDDLTKAAKESQGKKPNDKMGDEDDDMMKGLAPEARALVEKALSKAEESEKKLAKMEDDRLEQAFISKAAKLDHLPADAETLGPILKRMSMKQIGDEDFDQIHKLLSGVNEVLKSSEIFKSIGHGGAMIKSGAEAELDTKAAELMKSDSSLTREQAATKAMEQHPELYAKYLRESRAN